MSSQSFDLRWPGSSFLLKHYTREPLKQLKLLWHACIDVASESFLWAFDRLLSWLLYRAYHLTDSIYITLDPCRLLLVPCVDLCDLGFDLLELIIEHVLRLSLISFNGRLDCRDSTLPRCINACTIGRLDDEIVSEACLVVRKDITVLVHNGDSLLQFCDVLAVLHFLVGITHDRNEHI